MNLPELDVSPERLYQMLFGSIRSKILITAIELNIFDQLSEPISADEVAKAINSHLDNTMIFLNGLTACELILKNKGLYQNTPIAQTFLVQGTPTYMGAAFIARSKMSDKMLNDLTKLVREGRSSSFSEDNVESQERWAHVATWMANYERAGIAQQMADMVSKLPEFPSFGKMLDLGGGPGIFCIAMVMKHPAMEGIIFDSQAVTEVAKQFIREYEMEDRIGILAGDYNHDAIGSGYDLIWASSTLNFARENMDSVMKKIYDALNSGGIFINLSEGLRDEGTKSESYVLHAMVRMMTGPIKIFEQGFIADAMLNAGFRTVRSRTLHTAWGEMELDIARK